MQTIEVTYTNVIKQAVFEKIEGVKNMNLQEVSRIILGLRAAGWDEKSINDFILFIETGEEQYKPKENPGK